MTLHRNGETKSKMCNSFIVHKFQSDLCHFSQQPCEIDLIIPVLPKKKPVMQLKSGRAMSQDQDCVTQVQCPFLSISQQLKCSFRTSMHCPEWEHELCCSGPRKTAGTLGQVGDETIRRKSFLVPSPDSWERGSDEVSLRHLKNKYFLWRRPDEDL